ncbi:DNA-binding response regulator [Photobacterium jeanii]|nr:DNA-binding response regulator [Photobacterium jeanii]
MQTPISTLEQNQANKAIDNQTTRQILLVEDDNDLAELIAMHLKMQGYTPIRTTSLAKAKQVIDNTEIDLVVLDRGLDDGDGLELCQALRQQQNWLPILMLTARDGEMDKVAGLEAGADDYLTKPFSVLEFQARVRTLFRRQTVEQQKQQSMRSSHHKEQEQGQHSTEKSSDPNALQFEGLVINPERHQVEVNHQMITLTATEFTLLHFLAKKPGRVYSKEELLQQVWQTDYSGYQHTVCSTVNRLRTKLEHANPDHPFIHTVWGVGYKFEAA